MSDAEAKGVQTVGIVGLGLIGGSVGLALRDPGRLILGVDRTEEAGKVALSRFCVDRLAPFEEVANCDVVFLAVPPGVVVEVSEGVYAAKKNGGVVTDCCSVKTEISEWAEKNRLSDFVPGHPMAGHERSGAEYASAWLFRGARWLLTPTRHTKAASTQAVEKLIRSAGAAPVRLQPGVHDRHVAVLSHLPHVIAATLVQMADQLEHVEVGAGSWRDLTRVGGVDPTLWTQILTGNRRELIKVLDDFEKQISTIRQLLESSDKGSLLELLKLAQTSKAKQESVIKSEQKSMTANSRRQRK